MGEIVFAGGNNITLSQSISNSSATITISAFNQTVQTQSTHVHIISGNTTGTTASMSTGTILLAGGNNITLSQNANSVTISGPSTIPSLSAGVSTAGNTSGSTGTVSNQIVFVGGNNITLSQSTGGASSATITISGGGASSASGILLVSDFLVGANTNVTTITGLNTSDVDYTFHIYLSNAQTGTPVFSIMFNGISAGATRQFLQATSNTATAGRDNNPYAINLSASEEAQMILNMFIDRSPLRLFGVGNDRSFEMIQQIIRQTATAATNVTALVISANVAGAIGSDTRIIWYKKGALFQ